MSITAPATLTELVHAVREAVAVETDWAGTAELVAEALRAHLPGPDVLTPAQREGDPDRYVSYTLHVEPDATFSVIALVWRPGQATRIHDHLTWCVFGVVQGVEHEELFDADGRRLGESDNLTGDVSGFAPPGDIHRVRNAGDTTAISIHIYGTDIDRAGSSVRRYYDCRVSEPFGLHAGDRAPQCEHRQREQEQHSRHIHTRT